MYIYIYIHTHTHTHTCGARGGVVVKALRYKPEGRRFVASEVEVVGYL